jgi:hypothetical protein
LFIFYGGFDYRFARQCMPGRMIDKVRVSLTSQRIVIGWPLHYLCSGYSIPDNNNGPSHDESPLYS